MKPTYEQLLETCINGGNVISLFDTEKEARHAFRDSLEDMIPNIKRVKISPLTYIFYSGATLRFMSTERPEQLRGLHPDLLDSSAVTNMDENLEQLIRAMTL